MSTRYNAITGVVNATSHVHHDDGCFEIVHCTGDVDKVRDLVHELRNFDAVRRWKMTLIDGSERTN